MTVDNVQLTEISKVGGKVWPREQTASQKD
jgi:hypothetical protein